MTQKRKWSTEMSFDGPLDSNRGVHGLIIVVRDATSIFREGLAFKYVGQLSA